MGVRVTEYRMKIMCITFPDGTILPSIITYEVSAEGKLCDPRTVPDANQVIAKMAQIYARKNGNI